MLQTALQAAEAVERQEEVNSVRELIEATDTGHVALGIKATPEALSDGRVYMLFVADQFHAAGAECPQCQRLAAGGERCARCGSAMVEVADLRERAVELATAHGARIEEVSGEAAAALMDHGGLGAWTRY